MGFSLEEIARREVDDVGDNLSAAHAVVLVGLRGDTADFPSLEVRIVDPAGAIRRSATLGSVIKFYEGLAGPATDASAPQILYF